jgi:hypothetical protein
MTAVNPTRLRFQIEGLLSFFETPQAFRRKLHDLFAMYGNQTMRFGDTASSIPLLPMYHLPHPVLRQLKFDIKPKIQANPETALVLADELWQDDFFEVLQVAIFILGNIPADDPDILVQRLRIWLSPVTDPVIAAELFSEGTQYLHSQFPRDWEILIQSFLSDENPKLVNFGLIGLREGLKYPTFSNLPGIFRLVSPFIRDPNPDIMRSLEKLIQALTLHSPTETFFFLKQMVAVSHSPDTARLIKTCIKFFPESLQQDLKSALKR